MWEITLIGKYRDIVYMQELVENLENLYNSRVVSAISYNKNLICSIAISGNVNKNKIKTIVYESIIKIVKCEYLEENLIIFKEDKSLNTFMLSSLILLDLKEEIIYAKKNSNWGKTVSIRSFVYFKLNYLIKLWNNLCKFINRKFGNSFEDLIYLDFLKFLASNIPTKFDILYIEEKQDFMYLLDKTKNTISVLPKDDEIGVIVNVIIYCPKKLIINCMEKLSEKVKTLLSYIFEDRLSLLL